MINNKKGQLMIVNIIMFFIVIALAAIISPIISNFMSNAINSSNATGTSLLLMQSIVPIFWIGIIMLFFIMIGAGRSPQQQY
jgi:uncharacterized membrane protein